MTQGPSPATQIEATAEPGPSGNAFLALLAQIKPEIERRIDARFEEKITRARSYGPKVATMLEASRDLTMRGGKRVRAGLIAAGWIAAGGESPLDAAIDGGVAFELLQSYLLIQDDWMDGDTTRRGGPSVHAALAKELGNEATGAAAAILASDMTWGLAVETLTSMESLSAARRLEVLQVFLRVHDDVVLGQQIDVLGKAEDVEVMHDLKTGSYTMRGPLLIGATLAGGSPKLMAGLARFAAPLGIAFQLRDDLLGAFGDHAETGKPVGNDIVAGKRTCLVAEAERLANEEERRAIAAAHGRAGADAETIAAATRALVTSGARRAVEERQRALCDAATKELETIEVPGAARSILAGVVEALRVRPAGPEARRVTERTRAEGSASGKVILFGEHAVVYGSPAIAAGLDRGAHAVVTRLPGGPSTMQIGGRTVVAEASSEEDLGRALFALLDVAPSVPSVHVEARSELPAGGGLGSSAALAVAIARAAEALSRGEDASSEEEAASEARALARAAAWERIFHGNPSGIDATAAARGGIFRYARVEGVRPITPREELVFCVGSTGLPSSTRDMVALVAAQHAKDPVLVHRSIDAVTSIVSNAALAIEAGDMRALGDLMNMNQLVLSGLFVSTSEIEELCGIARSEGALGAKLTGGGGGGCVIALVPPSFRDDGTRDQEREDKDAARILDAWRGASARYEGFVARIRASRRVFGSSAEGGVS